MKTGIGPAEMRLHRCINKFPPPRVAIQTIKKDYVTWCIYNVSLVVVLLLIAQQHLVRSVNTNETTIFRVNKNISFVTNLKTTAKCACKTPQPRLIHIDELEEYHAPNAIFAPRALLIHRCDRSTGYCPVPGHICTSVESQEENVSFHVKNLFYPFKPLVTVSLRNHTRCKCVKKQPT